ncbi:MAG: hypothetical protein C0425_09345 [Chlorobiaceae bacterium]|nr:hypothetical protein [Chlorobiaceae bacterium]
MLKFDIVQMYKRRYIDRIKVVNLLQGREYDKEYFSATKFLERLLDSSGLIRFSLLIMIICFSAILFLFHLVRRETNLNKLALSQLILFN